MSKGYSGLFSNTTGTKTKNVNGILINQAQSASVKEVNYAYQVNNAHSLSREYTANSVIQNFKDGNLITERYFDNSGKSYLDIDYTNHGNPKMHPNVPHEHAISFESGNFRREKKGRRIAK